MVSSGGLPQIFLGNLLYHPQPPPRPHSFWGGAIWPMNMHCHRSRHAHTDTAYMLGATMDPFWLIFSLLLVWLKRHATTGVVLCASEMGRHEGTQGTMAAVTLYEGVAPALSDNRPPGLVDDDRSRANKRRKQSAPPSALVDTTRFFFHRPETRAH